MSNVNESIMAESIRMIEAHLERIADSLENLAAALDPETKPTELASTESKPTATTPTLTRGPLETLAHKLKETHDPTYRNPPYTRI